VLTLGVTQKRVKVAVQLKLPDRLQSLADVIEMGALPRMDEEKLNPQSCLDLIRSLEQRKWKLDAAINELWLRHAALTGRAGRDPASYIAEYFKEIFQVSVFWGTAREFVAKLQTYVKPQAPGP
jgi:hypothetical protein